MTKFVLLFLVSFGAFADGDITQDPRYCAGPIKYVLNKSTGKMEIYRDMAEWQRFKNIQPCPATRKSRGACPGWRVDHEIPLANHGCDRVFNMHWMPAVLKEGKGKYPKDRWERVLYGDTSTLIEMPEAGLLVVQ